ncbi:MAG: hypothetical protein P8N56_01820 [Schleiferiaceae bacterium]|nr:hypothetical protein [Schleiferiaceae bacterium]
MSNWAVVAPMVPIEAHPQLEKIVGAYSGRIRLAPKRQSKWGDFRWRSGELSRISVNRDLSPEAFLITLLHELAHAQVHAWDPGYRLPHGPEWQRRYRDLMQPFLYPAIFSEPVRLALQRSMRQPKASCGADPQLLKALNRLKENESPTVESLAPGSQFQSANGRIFLKGSKRRTRIECVEISTGRTFAVHPLMEVNLLTDESISPR